LRLWPACAPPQSATATQARRVARGALAGVLAGLLLSISGERNAANKKAISSRRAWLVCAGLLGAGLARAGVPKPDEPAKPPTKAPLPTNYLVSALLREGGDGFTIKLVHLIQSANSRDEAAGIFTRLAFEQYPGHAVAKTLVAEISLPPGPCAKDKQTAPEAAATAFYAISTVMRKGADGPDLMLLNGWMPGNNADDALKRALQEAAVKYPNYAAIRTLVTELQVARPACSAPGLMRGHRREA
jgi:hypothetical protein